MSNPELDSKLIENAPTKPIVKLEVEVEELNTIFASLQELPHRLVDNLLKKLFNQAHSQLKQD